jgi:hypothetical protein
MAKCMGGRKRWISFVWVLSVFLAGTAWSGIPVDQGDYTGVRTTPGTAGLNATGGYLNENGGVKIAWNIEYNSTSGYWNYTYTITDKDGSSIQPDLSHWIIEISPEIPLSQSEINDYIFDANADVQTPGGGSWEPDPNFPNTTQQGANKGNPNLGIELIGIKFDTDSVAVNGVYTFKSVEPPVWGDVYLK